MKVLVKENGTTYADLQFEDEVVYIGSRPGCGILLQDPRIPLQHAVLAPDVTANGDQVWTLAPLTDETPSRLNGKTVTARTRVNDGDRIEIGQYELILSPDRKEANRATVEEARRQARKSLPLSTIIKNIDDEILLSGRRFGRLSRISFHLAQCRDLRSLLDVTLTSLLQAFVGVRLAWVGVRRQGEGKLEFVEGRLANASVGDDPPMLKLLQQRCLDRSLMVCVPNVEDAEYGSLVAVPLVNSRGTLGMIYIDSHLKARAYRERHLNLMIGIAAQVTHQLEAIIDDQVRSQAAASAGEVSLAHQVQARLDPKGLPQWPGLQIAAYCKPGQEICSDVYDIVKLTGGGAGMFVAKAQASQTTETLLMMTEARATFRIACLHNDAPHTVLRQLNWLLLDRREQRRLDALVLFLEPGTGMIRYASAGGCYGVIIDAKGTPRPLARNTAPPVATAHNPEYAISTETLKPGETLGFFTPGITAAANSNGQSLKANEVVASLCDGFGQPAGNTLDDLVTDLAAYLKDGAQPQDVTLLLLHREQDLPG